MEQQESGGSGASKVKVSSLELADLYAKKICVYCLGEYGIETFYYLKRFSINVACFGDRDEKKHGYVFENICCISFEEVLKLDKSSWIVIVAIKEPERLVQGFKNQGISTISIKEVYRLLSNTKEVSIRKPLQSIDEIITYKEVIEEAFCRKAWKKVSGNREIQQIADDYLTRMSKERKY